MTDLVTNITPMAESTSAHIPVVPLWICLAIELVREPRSAEATAG